MGTRSECTLIDESVLDCGPWVDEATHIQFATDVLDEEIKWAIFFFFPDDKPSGRDGYSAQFFKSAWNTVGPLLVEAV